MDFNNATREALNEFEEVTNPQDSLNSLGIDVELLRNTHGKSAAATIGLVSGSKFSERMLTHLVNLYMIGYEMGFRTARLMDTDTKEGHSLYVQEVPNTPTV